MNRHVFLDSLSIQPFFLFFVSLVFWSFFETPRVKHKIIMILIIMMINVNDNKNSVHDNISSNQIVILQSPEATLTIMIRTTTVIIIITTKIRAIIVI